MELSTRVELMNWLVGQGFDLGNGGAPTYTPFAVAPYMNLNLFGWEICNTDSIANGAATTATENFIVNNFYYTYTLAGQATPVTVFPQMVNRAITIPARIGR